MVYADWSTLSVLAVQVFVLGTTLELVPILGAFLLLDVLLGRWVAWRCQPEVQRIQLRTIGHELVFSVLTMAAAMLVQELVHRLEAAGLVALVDSAEDWPGRARVAVDAAYMLLGFDVWFYVVHRTMHVVPLLYRTVHKAHHRSTAPTALTSAAFSPLETFLMSMGLLLLLVLRGTISSQAVALSGLVGAIYNMVVHLGIEVFPRWWHSNPVTAQAVCTTFHDVHHAKFTCNYGLYLTTWDRLFGTISPAFDRRYHERWMGSGKEKADR